MFTYCYLGNDYFPQLILTKWTKAGSSRSLHIVKHSNLIIENLLNKSRKTPLDFQSATPLAALNHMNGA
jgi:hypothetical protein